MRVMHTPPVGHLLDRGALIDCRRSLFEERFGTDGLRKRALSLTVRRPERESLMCVVPDAHAGHGRTEYTCEASRDPGEYDVGVRFRRKIRRIPDERVHSRRLPCSAEQRRRRETEQIQDARDQCQGQRRDRDRRQRDRESGDEDRQCEHRSRRGDELQTATRHATRGARRERDHDAGVTLESREAADDR